MEVRILSSQPQFVTKVKFLVLSTAYGEELTALRLPSWLLSILFASHDRSDQPEYTFISSSSIEWIAKVLAFGIVALIIWLNRFLSDVGLILFAL